MHIHLLRHGIAVPHDDPAFASDSDRPLTAKGTKRMRQAARGLLRLGIDFDAILTSPLVRARQTAEIVAKRLDAESLLEELVELAPGHSPLRLVERLEGFKERGNLLLVGHEPLLGQAAGVLLGGTPSPQLVVPLKKGSLCRIDIDSLPISGPGKLQWMLSPKQLRLLAP